MFYYRYFSGRGREILADSLGIKDPFRAHPKAVLERILIAGFKPVVDQPRTERWPTAGTSYTIARDNQIFILAVDRAVEQISLQECRADAYDDIE